MHDTESIAESQRELARLRTRLRREGSTLLHAQCWVWGQDIRHGEGNLLLRHGFQRLRPPAGTAGCSQYTLQTPEVTTVRLWGFGVFCGGDEGIYLNRFDFVPRRTTLQDAWKPEPLARGCRWWEMSLVCSFLRWAVSYEMWIEGTMGRAYRRSTLAGWSRTAELADLAAEWLGVLDVAAQLASAQAALPRAVEEATK